ncbi:hypothetical protein BP5796_02446 [Coleophoma crateriformis]|uniref:Asparagine--tRNA ligase N-terminal domain-containing protein n=1 Tax=Coleophoma crateriformis TaxID=565419 RepID=A0A3D8SYN6_9HELO|nr:hypothetical protein BP5796_02446 [Coleophoma crateriformis]
MDDVLEKTIIYIDKNRGSDDRWTKGTKENPFATLFAAYLNFPPESSSPPPLYYTRIDATESDPGTPEWNEAAKSAIKKAEENEEKRQLALIEARQLVILQDEGLPAAIKMKISAQNPSGVILGKETRTGTRARVVGRIDNLGASKTRTFVYLSDTRGVLLCIFSGPVNVVAPILFQKQASLEVYGEMKEVPTENKAP